MSWDKIKVSTPVSRGPGADGEPANARPPDNPASGDNPSEGLAGPGQGRRTSRGRAHQPDAHPRVQDVLNEGKQTLDKLLGRAEGTRGERARGGDGHVPPGQAKKNNQDGGRTEGRDSQSLRGSSPNDGERGVRRESLPREDARQRGVEGDHPRDARHAGRGDSGPLRDPRRAGHDDDHHGRSREARGDDNGRRTRGDGDGLLRTHGDDNGRRTHGEHDGRRTRGNGRGDDDGPGDNLFRTQSHNSGRDRGVSDHNPNGRGLLDGLGVGRRDGGGVDVASLVSYLRGESGGANLPVELRRTLDGASRVLGPDFLRSLEARAVSADGKHAVKFVEHALARVARTLERVAERGGAAASGLPQGVLGEAVGELLAASLLDKYFRQAEKTGGRVVAQAEAALARLLYGDGRGGEGGGRRPDAPGGFDSPRRAELPAPHPLEVLRDLNAGAFRPAEVGRSPFPLTGRALVATEMMELMRTLDAVDRVTRELLTAARAGTTGAAAPFVAGDADQAPALALLRALAGTAAGAELLDELLGALPPSLPGRAARQEIPRLVAALGGMLVDAEGRTFVAKDGAPLKLDQLLWLGSLGGVLKSGAASESFPVHLSPLLIYGFDAVYSLIGFDGRTLNPPHFAAVQAQVNGSEMEWVFGQPPLSEGWMRALIERLKDSAQADHNLLGEMLEEALADGRFHAALVGGTVSEGEAVADTFAVSRLLPGPSLDAAFSPA